MSWIARVCRVFTLLSDISMKYSFLLCSFPWNESDMGCDNTLRLKQIDEIEFSAPAVPPKDDNFRPPVPPRPDNYVPDNGSPYLNRLTKSNSGSKINTSSTNGFSSTGMKRDTDSCKLPRRHQSVIYESHSKSNSLDRRTPIALKEIQNPASIWHRDNSPHNSPSKGILKHVVGR